MMSVSICNFGAPHKTNEAIAIFCCAARWEPLAEIAAPKNLRIVTDELPPTPTPADPQDIDLTDDKLVFEENFDVLSVAKTDAKGDKTWYVFPPFGPVGVFSSSHFTSEAMQSIDGVLVNTAS